jgi:hypothetical protein
MTMVKMPEKEMHKIKFKKIQYEKLHLQWKIINLPKNALLFGLKELERTNVLSTCNFSGIPTMFTSLAPNAKFHSHNVIYVQNVLNYFPIFESDNYYFKVIFKDKKGK